MDGPPQLFDLHVDPAERNNLAASADHQLVLARMDARLRSLLDPEAVDAHAKQEQRAKIAEHGGIEAVRARGAFTNSPTPDESPQFKQYGS